MILLLRGIADVGWQPGEEVANVGWQPGEEVIDMVAPDN